LAEQLARENFARLQRPVFSTITGQPLGDEEDVRALLCRQVTSPVRFSSALGALLGERRGVESGARTLSQPHNAADLLIEVGPGTVLTGLARDATHTLVLALDAGGPSLRGLLRAVGAAFALGAPVRTAALFADRFTRPFSLDTKPKFFVNPCELAPVSEKTVPQVGRACPQRADEPTRSLTGALGTGAP